MTLTEAKEKLAKYGQEHLLRHYDELTDSEKEAFLAQIERTDMSVIASAASADGTRGFIEPLGAMELDEIAKRADEFRAIGLDAIREGKVGAILLAGGMGTRLGSDDPKGMYNIGLTKDVYIFQRLIENLLDVVREADAWIHLFVMTSEKNHEKTVAFLKEKSFFGYDESHVHFFVQDMAPAVDYDGKIFLEEKGWMSTSPNGNGSWYSSMVTSGMDRVADEAGIEWLNVFAVDNVLQRIADPVFVGATIAQKCTVGAKVVKKNAPDERIGVMCLEDKHPSIVEYYELTDELMNTKNEKGEPAYYFGVILNYLFRVDELKRIVEDKMPLHVVEKKIKYYDDATGKTVKPEEVNGRKFETLVLDMIRLSESCLPFEVVREREFAPIKNPTGIDSVESARALCQGCGIEL